MSADLTSIPPPKTPSARRKRVLGLALPIIGGMVSQNVLNLVDAWMVGHLGDVALAAVGVGGLLNFVTAAFVLGLGAGVQAMAARRVGEKRHTETAVPLNGGLVLAASLAVPWSALLYALAPQLYGLVAPDAAVIEAGVPYLRPRLVAMTAIGMNIAFRGYWNATDRSMLYMGTLVFMHTVNIFLNWVLIFGNLGAPEMGARGAGLASALSTYAGLGAYFVLGIQHARSGGFLRGLPSRESMATMIRLTVPSGLQQFFFAAGLTVFMALVGRIGTSEQAATHVIIQLLLVGVLPGLGFGLASASLVGQALGRGDADDAERWGWEVCRMSMALVFLLTLPAIIAPRTVLMPFLHDPATLDLAVGSLRLIAMTLWLDTAGSVLMNSLVGAGDTRTVMIIATSLQWLLFLPAAWLVGPVLGWGLFAVFTAQVIYRSLQSVAFASIWKRGAWKAIRV